MITIRSVFLASLLAIAAAGPVARSGMVVREAKPSVPEGFVLTGAAPASQTIPLRIALVQSNMAGLEAALYDVSTPGSANYGKHLSKEEVEAYVKPSQNSTAAVMAYLQQNGVNATTLSPAGDWLGFSIPVSQANEMFDADFSEFKHVASGKTQIRTLSYSIPSGLAAHMDYVHPTTNFVAAGPGLPLFVSPLKTNGTATPSRAVPSSCAKTVTPACLQDLYGIPTALATESSSTLAVAGFLGQYAQKADLKSFLTSLRPDLPSSTTFALDTLDFGSDPQGTSDAGDEAGVPVTFVSAGDINFDGWNGFLDMVNYLLKQTVLPTVLTTSYAFNEPGLSASASNTLCNAYMQLGARGTSIGVSGGQSQSCTTFIVTSVGGTTGITETSASFSGGGFSTIFTAPSYQSSVTAAYVKSLGTKYSGTYRFILLQKLYTGTGRGFPDISAQAENVEIWNGGVAETVAGTSCASPISASIVALLNDELVAAGKSPLGFLNPLLYANPSALNDITTGSNPGCNTNGFSAAAGWDPVTGLGTPNYAKLKALAPGSYGGGCAEVADDSDPKPSYPLQGPNLDDPIGCTSYLCNMEIAPPEIWAKISSYACTDAGSTGRSLSLVSQFIRDASAPFKLQSMSIRGQKQAIAFQDMLLQTPPHLRRVRYLYLSPTAYSPTTLQSSSAVGLADSRSEEAPNRFESPPELRQLHSLNELKELLKKRLERTEQLQQTITTLSHILQATAEWVEILYLENHDPFHVKFSPLLTFPRLEELASGPRLIPDSAGNSDIAQTLVICPKLRHWHIACGSFMQFRGREREFFSTIATIAPSITHLLFSGLQQEFEWFPSHLKVALDMIEPQQSSSRAAFSEVNQLTSHVGRLPKSIESVYLRPAPPPARGDRFDHQLMWYERLMGNLEALSRASSCIVLLPSCINHQARCMMSEWEERINGAEGWWDLRDRNIT
ncbi:hypothetical protein HWV62_41050 [Athelia sp. TMB]|nr:hypothetical protein HWV62_41050 [Athelia sp. TMB]